MEDTPFTVATQLGVMRARLRVPSESLTAGPEQKQIYDIFSRCRVARWTGPARNMVLKTPSPRKGLSRSKKVVEVESSTLKTSEKCVTWDFPAQQPILLMHQSLPSRRLVRSLRCHITGTWAYPLATALSVPGTIQENHRSGVLFLFEADSEGHALKPSLEIDSRIINLGSKFEALEQTTNYLGMVKLDLRVTMRLLLEILNAHNPGRIDYILMPSSSAMIMAAFSPMTRAVPYVFALTFPGAIDRSATLSPRTPYTFSLASTTPPLSRGFIAQVPS